MKWNNLLILLTFLPACIPGADKSTGSEAFLFDSGAIVRGDTSKPELSLVFTGDEFADGGMHILSVLEQQKVRGSFFLTGNFFRNPEFESLIEKLLAKGHYLGAHSDQHLLYCDWEKRDSLLVSRTQFQKDLEDNYQAMERFGISKEDAPFFLPPYEWYNDSIAAWTVEMKLTLINMSPGTLSHADYTLPGSAGYRSSTDIYESILEYEESAENGLNGFILLCHIGSSPERTDKFHIYLDHLISELKSRGYTLTKIDKLLSVNIL